MQEDTPANCDDSNGGTDDSCDSAIGCEHLNNTAACDDQNACTVGDACLGGSCVSGSPLVCDDANFCTDDGCAPESGCVFMNNTLSCDDGDSCTVNDACAGGVCAGTYECRLYGDVAEGYCVIDVDDLLRVLDGFVDPVSFPEADIAPCGGNAVIDVDDILAELDAFAGNPLCPDPCVP